jgi:hypothetical protein
MFFFRSLHELFMLIKHKGHISDSTDFSLSSNILEGSVSDPHPFHADPDPALKSQIRIQGAKGMRIHADPDPDLYNKVLFIPRRYRYWYL